MCADAYICLFEAVGVQSFRFAVGPLRTIKGHTFSNSLQASMPSCFWWQTSQHLFALASCPL